MINNLRYISVMVLDKVLNNGAYSNITLKEYLDKSDLKDIDKKLLTEIVYGTIRYKLTIDNIISNFVRKIEDKHISTIILRSAIYQLKYLDKIPEYSVLNESVEISKRLCKSKSGFINGVLRNYLRSKQSIENKKNTLEYEYSFATWMIDLFKKQYPNSYIDIMRLLNKRGDTCYRVNSNILSRDEFIEKFKGDLRIEGIGGFKNAVRVKSLHNLSKNMIYTQGFLSVQSLSSQLACEILSPNQGDIVIDLCAAPGGKTTYIAELMKDKGKVFSCDMYEHKINLIKSNAKRLKLKSIDCLINDATQLNMDFINKADKVILDAPCSGLGVINKKPEIKWFKKYSDLEEIISIQKKIINVASNYVKSGGILMYTTCTINKDENEKLIEEFIETNKDFSIEAIDKEVFENLTIQDNKGMITILPDELSNGFFITRLRKN